jgi:hypothetical protein
VVALHAAVRDSRLVPRPSFWQLSHLRRAHAHGQLAMTPTALVIPLAT